MDNSIDRFNHINGLKKLQSLGYSPDLVLDLGSYIGSWTTDCIQIYPDAVYHLFDATLYEEADNIQNTFSNVHLHIELLDDIPNKNIDWYYNKGTGDSIYKENTKFYEDTIPIQRTTNSINNILPSLNINNCNEILIKIDCQGSEIPILKGSSDILDRVNVIILEIPFFGNYNTNVPSFLEHIQFMDSIQYIPMDIIQTHYVNNYLLQLDIIFIKKGHSFETDFNKILSL